MDVKELIEILKGFNQEEEVVIGNVDEFNEATEENSCELESIREVAEGVLYDEQVGCVALLFKKKNKKLEG